MYIGMAPFFRLSGALPLQRLFYPRTDMVHYRSPRGHALSGTSLPGAVAPPCASTIFVGVPRLGPALTVTDPCHPGASLGAFRGSPSFGSLPLVPSEVLPAPGNLPTPSVQERSPWGGLLRNGRAFVCFAARLCSWAWSARPILVT